ncbi:MAG: DinB family protein [Candidatus Acidiferrum sp.]
MKKIVLGLVFVVGFVGGARGQGAAPAAQTGGPVANPVMTVVRMMLPRQEKSIIGAIEAMPADKFGYKPTRDQISFGHLAMHIAQSNNGLCAKIADVPAPKTEELKETDSKDVLLAAAKASFAFCSTALANVDDSKLGDNVDFGRVQGPRALGVFFLAGGWSDHYGAAAMYLRLNGILPPTAQPKK